MRSRAQSHRLLSAPLCVSELPHPETPRDLSFYAVFFFAVLPVWSVPLISWIYVVYTLRSGTLWFLSWLERVFFLWALAEVFFSVYHFNQFCFVKGPSPIHCGTLGELQAAFHRVLQAGLASLPPDGFDEETLADERPGSPYEPIVQLEPHDPRAVDFRNSIRTWFNRVPWSHIRRQEMYEWLYWSTFNEPMPDLACMSSPRRRAIDEALDLIERRSGMRIPDGTNPLARPMLLTLDPVNVIWRPLFWYTSVAFANLLTRFWFVYLRNMRVCSKDGLDYLLYEPASYDQRAGPSPVVFVHGLGLGILQYFMVIENLLSVLRDRPLLVLLQPEISQQIFHPNFLAPKGRKNTVTAIVAMLQELGWVEQEYEDVSSSDEERPSPLEGLAKTGKSLGVTMFSHSNGSFLHAWMLKEYPRMVKRSCFVDPVTFCSWEGDVCYNFLYRRCANGLQLAMRYFVGCELGVANVLHRHYDWPSNSLWYEEIPNARNSARTKFFLGGKDAIVRAERVRRYLTSHGIRKGLWYDPDGVHGQALRSNNEGHKELMRWLKESDL